MVTTGPTLTLAVSLEAIFLSTFVMIAQNRQGAFAQAKADHDFDSQEKELATNTELTKEIHRLTQELHVRLLEAEDAHFGFREAPCHRGARRAGTDDQHINRFVHPATP